MSTSQYHRCSFDYCPMKSLFMGCLLSPPWESCVTFILSVRSKLYFFITYDSKAEFYIVIICAQRIGYNKLNSIMQPMQPGARDEASVA
jgi:hypothetical protein